MQQQFSLLITVLGNFVLIAFLVVYGFRLFEEYHTTGRWAKNITGLLGGLGMFALAFALILTPENATALLLVAESRISVLLLWLSSMFLLAAIAAYGLITYNRPLRLWHERRLRRHLRRDLPKIP